MVRLFPILALLGLVIIPTAAHDSPQYHDYSQYIHWMGGYENPGDEISSAVTCEIQGTSYWATTGLLSGLSFYGFGEDWPEPVGNLPLPGVEQGVVFDGGFAYVIAQPARLNKVIVSYPSSPYLQWTDVLPYDPVDIAHYGQYLLIACGINGLLVYDLTQIFNFPTGVVGSWNGTAHKVVMSGSTPIVLTDTGITSIDLSDPTAPVQLDNLPLANAWVLLPDDTRLYVSEGDGLTEVDVSDPGQMTVTRNFPNITDSPAISSMSLAEDGMFFTAANKMYFLELESGQVTWSGLGTHGALSMVQSEGNLGLACGDSGFQVFAHKPPFYAPSSGPFHPHVTLRDMQIEGDFLFGQFGPTVYCYDMGLTVPFLAWTHHAEGTYESIEALNVTEDRVYIGYNNGMIRILEYDQNARRELAYFPSTGEEVKDLGPIPGHLAVFADPTADQYREGVVEIYDLSDEANPVLTDTYINNQYPRMLVSGTTLVLFDHTSSANGIRLLDASDPSNLVTAAQVSTPEFSEVTVNGDHLYVVEPPILKAVDISDPYFPLQGPVINIPNGWYLETSGDVGYLLYTDLVFDLSDPLRPVGMGSTSNQWVQGVHYCAAGDGYLVVGNSNFLTVMAGQGTPLVPVDDLVPEVAGLGLRAVPNPFNPRVVLEFNLPAAGRAEAEVFDLRGRRVAHLEGDFAQAGTAQLVWDGRSSDGRELPSGVYLARVKTDQGQAVRKVVMAR